MPVVAVEDVLQQLQTRAGNCHQHGAFFVQGASDEVPDAADVLLVGVVEQGRMEEGGLLARAVRSA
jgi:hypothetical protein